MAMFEGAANPIINSGNFAAVANAGEHLNLGASNDIVDILYSRSATAGLLDAAERFDAPRCDGSTRVSMLRGMKMFVQEGGPSSMYWLHGPAGVGKSALGQSLALSLKGEGDHAASFFFSRTAPGRNDGNQLIVTLACQLAVNIPALKPLLSKVVKQNPLILNATNAIKMQSLIVDPINQLHKMALWSPWSWVQGLLGQKIYPRLILVDGLDECNDPRVQRDLILCIGLAVRQLLLPLRFVITSRPESYILATFELDPVFSGPNGVKVLTRNLGDDKDADEQITTFLLKEFAEIRRTHPIREYLPQPWPRPDQIAQLVLKSSKGFIYPATVIRYIKMPKTRPDECLERVLGSSKTPIRDNPYEPLDNLYRHIFESVPNANKEAIRNIFHFLVLPNDNLAGLITPRLIEQHFDYKPGHVQLVLQDLLCLVSLTGQAIKVLHASLPDFLLDQSRSGPLCINIGIANAMIVASFPVAMSNSARIPNFRFVEFLQLIMQGDMSDMLQYRLVDVDLSSQYKTLEGEGSHSSVFPDATQHYLDCIAFMAAYFLVLVVKNIQQIHIRRHITEIKAHILSRYHIAASLHAVRDELVPAMIPLFRQRRPSKTREDYINHILAFEVSPSQRDIHEEIFELYFLMVMPFFDRGVKYCQDISHEPRAQQLETHSSNVSLSLLGYIISEFRDGPYLGRGDLLFLASDLLGVSLVHAGYSASLITLLGGIDLHITSNHSSKMRNIENCRWILTPHIVNYLKRVYSGAPAESQQNIQPAIYKWRRYLKNDL